MVLIKQPQNETETYKVTAKVLFALFNIACSKHNIQQLLLKRFFKKIENGFDTE